MDTRKEHELFDILDEKDGTVRVQSTETGKEVQILSSAIKAVEEADLRKKQMVALTSQEADMLKGMNRHDRRKWLKQERARRRKIAKP